MNRRRTIIIATLLLACIAAMAIHFSRPDEPSYHGKSLDQWLDQLDDHRGTNFLLFETFPPKNPQQMEAADAIRAIGTNAIPRLMRDLSASDSRVFHVFQNANRYFQKKVLHKTARIYYRNTPAEKKRWRATLALDSLGPAAQPAISELGAIVIASQFTNFYTVVDAAFVLAGMGPSGTAILTNYPSSCYYNDSLRNQCVISAIGQHPQLSTNLVPWLLAIATNRPVSAPLSPMEIWALGQIHADAPRVVPALVKILKSPNGGSTYRQYLILQTLALYGRQASNAVPDIKAAEADPQLQLSARQALEKIESDSK